VGREGGDSVIPAVLTKNHLRNLGGVERKKAGTNQFNQTLSVALQGPTERNDSHHVAATAEASGFVVGQ